MQLCLHAAFLSLPAALFSQYLLSRRHTRSHTREHKGIQAGHTCTRRPHSQAHCHKCTHTYKPCDMDGTKPSPRVDTWTYPSNAGIARQNPSSLSKPIPPFQLLPSGVPSAFLGCRWRQRAFVRAHRQPWDVRINLSGFITAVSLPCLSHQGEKAQPQCDSDRHHSKHLLPSFLMTLGLLRFLLYRMRQQGYASLLGSWTQRQAVVIPL